MGPERWIRLKAPGRGAAADAGIVRSNEYPAVRSVEGVSIHVGLADDEPHALVEAIGCFTRWPRGQIDRGHASFTSDLEGPLVDQLADTHPSRIAIDHHILNPCAKARRDRKHDEGHGSNNRALRGSGNQHRGCVRIDHRLQVVTAGSGTRRRKLRDEPGERVDHFVVDLGDLMNRDHGPQATVRAKTQPGGV